MIFVIKIYNKWLVSKVIYKYRVEILHIHIQRKQKKVENLRKLGKIKITL